MHLVLLLPLQLVLVKHKKHLLVEVLLEVIFDQILLHGGTPLAPVVLLTLEHFIELTLAASE